jgi:hypothetical protein
LLGILGIGVIIHRRASWGHIASDVSQAGSRRTMLRLRGRLAY